MSDAGSTLTVADVPLTYQLLLNRLTSTSVLLGDLVARVDKSTETLTGKSSTPPPSTGEVDQATSPSMMAQFDDTLVTMNNTLNRLGSIVNILEESLGNG